MLALPRLEFKEFTAWVKVDGKNLNCYGVSVEKKEKCINCWIPSEPGKNFTIHVRKGETKHLCMARAVVDGFKLCKQTFNAEKRATCRVWRDLGTGKRPFIFTTMELTEDAGLEDTVSGTAFIEQVGQIEVMVYRIVNLKTRPSTSKKKKRKIVLDPSRLQAAKVPEAQAKGKIMHQVTFGEETVRADVQPPSTNELCKDYDTKELLAHFIFRYRPLDALQRGGLAPHEPPSPPLEVPPHENERSRGLEPSPPLISGPSVPAKRKASTLDLKEEEEELIDDDGDREFKQRENALLEELKRLRNERRVKKESDGIETSRKRVKKEPRTLFTPGEVIDLT